MNKTTFTASIEKVQTMADGGIRITMDTSEDSIMQAAELMTIRKAGLAVEVEVKTIDPRGKR